nr:hypothetical protein BaRGS_034923 [Batillaria attramentaria]
MSSLSKEEYLKRYLSGDVAKDKKKKKKKTAPATKKANVRIIDDDVDLKSYQPSTATVEDLEDEAPTVAEFIDERPEHVRRLEEYRQAGRWKVMGKDKDENDIASRDYGVISSGNRTSAKGSANHTRQRHDSDSDPSPPRRGGRHDSDADPSPPRRRRHDSDSDHSPPRRKRHDSDSDHSPPRKLNSDSKHKPTGTNRNADNHDRSVQKSGFESAQSPTRRKRHDSDSDPSPPRRMRHDSDSDRSPPRKRRHDSDSDQSPPRKQNSVSSSNARKNKKQRQDSDSDQSPARRKRDHDSDQSPPRRKRDSDSDQSPPRRRQKGGDSDQSPPQRTDKSAGKDSAKPSKTLGGAKAGLSSAAEMKREAEKLKKREEVMFAKIEKEALGREAKTVFRDKSGKRRDLAAEREKEEEDAKKQAEQDKKYKEWGQGLKQKEMKEQNLQEYVHEISKPLARYKDDEDLDRIMREMDREGDPMAKFMKKKNTNKDNSANEKPRYRGPPPPPNRFGIQPGYRWDGVDRSNGFEKQIYAKMAEKKAVKEHAYKWSTEDM